MLKRTWMLILTLLLAGCEDPADSLMEGFPEGGPEGGALPMGAAGEGAPIGGEAGSGPVGAGLSANGTIIDNNSSVKAGEGVVVSGSLKFGGTERGSLLIDALRKEDSGVRILYSFILFGPGPFKLEFPKDAGELRLTAFVDIKGDGPTPDDPRGISTEIEVGDDDIDGVEIVVEADGDLGEFKPWETLPNTTGGVTAPVTEGEPEEGAGMPGPPAEGVAVGDDPSLPQDAPPNGKPLEPPPESAGDSSPEHPLEDGDAVEAAPSAKEGSEAAPPPSDPAPVEVAPVEAAPPEAPSEGSSEAASGDTGAGAPAGDKPGGLFKPNGEPWDPSAD